MAKLIVSLYPHKVAERLASLKFATRVVDASAQGIGVALECGSIVRFSVSLCGESIRNASFTSNGCGYAFAAADSLAEWLSTRQLKDLRGLNDPEIKDVLRGAVGQFPQERSHCGDAAVEAMRNALADLRARRVKEFKGEIPIVCTCFGVSEETIELLIRDHKLADVEEVGAIARAGTGCGSCRMMIQEMLDERG